MLSFYQQESYFSQIVYEKSQNINIYFLMKKSKNNNIILGFSFTYLVLVYPKGSAQGSYLYRSCNTLGRLQRYFHRLEVMVCKRFVLSTYMYSKSVKVCTLYIGTYLILLRENLSWVIKSIWLKLFQICYFMNPMNFNAEFPTLMKFCLLQVYLRYRISSYSCRGNYSFLNSTSEGTIQVFISLM